MAGILSNLRRRWEAFTRNPDLPAMVPTTGPDSSAATADVEYASGRDDYGVSQSRKKVYEELEEMDGTDELVSTALDVIAACATGYEPVREDSFTWRFDSKSVPQSAIDSLRRLKDRLDLGSASTPIVRCFVKHGAEYREIVWGGKSESEIVRFKHLLAWQIWPNLDDKNNKIPGYEQRKYGQKPGQGVALEEYQVVPYLYNSEDGVFGRGLMEPARGTFGRLRQVENGMVMARMFRSYNRLKHKVPVPPGSTVAKQVEIMRAYKKEFTTRRIPSIDGTARTRRSGMDVTTDIYIPEDGTKRGDVESLDQSNDQLHHIDDVEYLRERILVATHVPRTYMNLGTGNEGALTDSGTVTEDMQFARTLRQVQASLRSGHKRLGTLQLFFQGYDAQELGLQVDMPRVNTENFLQASKVQMNLGQAAKLFDEVLGGLPPEIVAKEFMNLSDAEQESLVSAIKSKEPDDAGEGGDQSDAPTLDDVARSLAILKVRTNQILGRSRQKIGMPEAYQTARDAILDALAA